MSVLPNKSVVLEKVLAFLILGMLLACGDNPAGVSDAGIDVNEWTDSSQDTGQLTPDLNVSDPGHEVLSDSSQSETDADPLTCRPNLDGRIEPHEFQAVVGIPVSFRLSPPGTERTIDTVGVDGGQGRSWDWSSDDTDDIVIQNVASSVDGQWFAEHFPSGEFSAPISRDGAFVGIYVQNDAAVTLLGVASAQAEPAEGQTLLIYDEPIVLYQFPIQPEQMWVSTGRVRNGTYLGLPYAGRDIYEIHVVSTGTLILPDLTFDEAHLVTTRVTLQPAVGASSSIRQVSFVFECYGEVARATSRDGETDELFSVAAEVRRLGL